MPNEMSLRETLESAINASTEAPDDVVEAPVDAPEVEAAPEAEPVETEAQAAARARDEKGRFAAAEEAKAKAKPAEKAGAAPKGVERADGKAAATAQGKPAVAAPPPAPAGPPVSPVKAPQSWKPAVRELASKLPAEYRPILEEVDRREKEIARTLQDTAQERQFATQVRQSLSPYEGIARASGVDAMTWAGKALDTVAGLYQGPPDHAIALAAQAIQLVQSRFGPQAIERVAAIIDGKAPAAASQQHQAAQAPPDIEAIVAQRFEQERAQQDAKAFLATNPEFLNDVKDDMLLVMQTARSQGRNMTWADAYDRACKMNEGVQEVLGQRKAAEAARAQAPAVQRSKMAASSIKPTPAPAATRPTGPRSLREDIEAAVAAQRT